MVLTFKFASTFDCNYIFALFNNADGCVIAPRITADLALFFFSNIEAFATESNFLFY